MDYLEFYKSLYNRELQRRFDLDNALNIPVGLVAILIALASYIVSNLNECDKSSLFWIVLGLTITGVICIILAIIFLSLSYSRMFFGFRYLNFASSKEWREFQKEVESYNINNPNEPKDFGDDFINKLNTYTDSHSDINNIRQKNLKDAKSFIVLALMFLLVALIIVVIKKYLI